MSTSAAEGRRRHPASLATGALVVGVGATAAVVLLPFLQFAYRAPALHVSLETANAMIAVLVAYLAYGRFRDSRRLQEFLLVLALCTVAAANLVLTALPFALTIDRSEDFSPWAALGIRLIGTLVLAAAALTPPETQIRRRRSGVRAAAAAGLVVVSLAGLTYGADLPPTVDPSLAMEDATRPQLVAHPLVLAVQALGAGLYAMAAVVFTRQAVGREDDLLRWLGAGCVLASFARVHYLLYPSLYSDFVYTGDLLRLGFYLLMLIGAAREIGSYWEARTRAAVLEDRRRMARDLHDGLTQELSYIRAQTQRLAVRLDVETIHRVIAAAGRAGDEARRAITALTRPVGEAFPDTLQRVADDLAHRHDIEIITHLDQTVGEVDAACDEALLRILSEAVHNAVRHGGASRIEVRLTGRPLGVAVTDNGRGFDATTGRTGGFGLTSMRERAGGVGAHFELASVPGEGATVRVEWP